MDVKNAQVLITGGGEGIGRGLAERFLRAGSRVIITGRNTEKLQRAATEISGLETFTNDISIPNQREALAQHVQKVMPGITILINNAGIQRRVALAKDDAPWPERQQEIDTLFSCPVHLNHLLIPLLLASDKESVLVNVTSGGAYIPQMFAPVYSACKAALHHYTLILRASLAETNCRVVELIPPAVQTQLAGPGMNHGASLTEFCDTVFTELTTTDKSEVGFGPTANLSVEISGKPVEELFRISSARFKTELY